MSAEAVRRWRTAHPGETLTANALREALDVSLYRAALREADLRGANLSWANLYGADLRGASVSHPLLSCDTPSGRLTLVPLHDHWHLRIGCWTGTTDDLRTLIAGDDWPEAEGTEQDKRRPVLAAIADLVDAHIAYHGLNPLGSPDPEAVTR